MSGIMAQDNFGHRPKTQPSHGGWWRNRRIVFSGSVEVRGDRNMDICVMSDGAATIMCSKDGLMKVAAKYLRNSQRTPTDVYFVPKE